MIDASVAAIDLSGIQVPPKNASETDLAEAVGQMRSEYRRSLETLLAYYRRYGYLDKSNWAAKELIRLHSTPRYPYIGDAVAASTRYEPKDTVGQADAMYAQARKLHEEATGLGGMLGGGEEKMTEALELYGRIIELHATSDKIDDAAFYAAEIYASDSQKEYVLALNNYQRCLTWNANTEHPVKFRMAVVYDYRMRDREKAVALYKEVVDSSPNRSNVRFAQERIRQLTDRASHEAPDREPGVPR
jgi:tetratricopeptide (TPR) repeat protein